ncbi:MAG: NAD(P)/FAD-dependent oxidoreductase [Pseudomonadota bacterium]|nr:NAD(P)/FAD-dependent oxidoreductase [Pseudomonadota bacterium]
MSKISRRSFCGILTASTATLAMPSLSIGAGLPRVVVIGGGAGGATAARYIAKDAKGAVDVTLIEASKRYYTCFFSNLYLGGFRNYGSIGHNYYGLSVNRGVNVVHDWALSVNNAARTVKLGSGATVGYDRLVLSPGIDLKYESVNGYSAAAQSRMPHAWKSGTQVQVLRNQVLNMPKGGTFIMVPPPNPYRCPPGPYERVSMIAHLLKNNNPTAKIIILDPKPKFSKQGLFTAGWEKHYPGMVEWIDSETHGGIKNVNAETMTIETDLDTFKADAACVVPAQKAGAIADAAGVTDGDWSPIVPASMQSRADENIYVLGDASVASAMPKSGFSANSQAKVAANHIRGSLTGSKIFPARFSNTCWSLVATNDGVKVGANYKAGDEKIEVVDKFISQNGEDSGVRKATYEESIGWYEGITTDMFS